MFRATTGAYKLWVGGRNIDLDAIVELERGGIALLIKSILRGLLHVGPVSMRVAMESGHRDANSSRRHSR